MAKWNLTWLILWLGLADAKIIPLSYEHCQNLLALQVITPDNPIPCHRLVAVTVTYKNFKGVQQNGEVVVLDVVGPQTQSLFNQLFQRKFPIHSIRPVEFYRGDDLLSMAANNSSGFNGRKIIGAETWSKHAYGVAIDINPLQNPYLFIDNSAIIKVSPEASVKRFLNRQSHRPDKVVRQGMSEEIRDLFFQHGYLRWGGYWDFPIDYQHFEIGSIRFIQWLLSLPLSQAQAEFADYAKQYRICRQQYRVGNIEQRIAYCLQTTTG